MGQIVAHDRQKGVLFRMSVEQRDQLHADAHALGISVQALLERRVLGVTDSATRRGVRSGRKSRGDEELPLTG